jgi:hypothetical protein
VRQARVEVLAPVDGPSRFLAGPAGTATFRTRGLVHGGAARVASVRRLVTIVDGRPVARVLYDPPLCAGCDERSARFTSAVSLPAGRHRVTLQAEHATGSVLDARMRQVIVGVPAVSASRTQLVPDVRGFGSTTLTVASGGVPAHGRLVVRDERGRTVASRTLSDGTRWTHTWRRTDRSGERVSAGRYQAVVTLRPSGDTRGGTVELRTDLRVLPPRQVPKGEVVSTPLGVLQRVPVRARVERLHLEVHQGKNQLLVVDQFNRIKRQVPIAGNPGIPKPTVSRIPARTPMSLDYTGEWRLPWFVWMIPGRGVGTHSIPTNVYDGRQSMNAADLGKDPGVAPLSHGCLRMHDRNARWIYRHVPNGTEVFWY